MNATRTQPLPVLLCADDFGISEGVDRAILDLASKGRLSAVTCMSLGAAWEKDAPLLKKQDVAVGLHVTLTYLPPLAKEIGLHHPTEKKLLLKSWTRRLDKTLLQKEIRAQFLRFIDVWGAPPDFIDGHQHVHVLPIVRDIILALRDEYAPGAWIRNVSTLSLNLKSVIQTLMGGWRFRRMLEQRGIRHNKQMRGPYNYKRNSGFGTLMETWCSGARAALIYCHPGFPDDQLARFDTLLEPRRREYDFLNSAEFGAWIGKKIILVKQP